MIFGRPGSVVWLLAHEIRLGWRGLLARRGRSGPAAWISVGIIIAAMLAAGVPLGFALREVQISPEQPALVWMALAVTLVVFTLMVSQTLAAAAETLYERDDLDLLFSSPVGPRKVLAVRFASVAFNIYTVFFLFLGPLLGPVALIGHPSWLGVFGLLAALALAACAIGMVLAMGLFRLIGARRTRSLAQIASAIIGASFFLITQLRAILGGRTDSLWSAIWRHARSGERAPPFLADLPLRAALGEPLGLAAVAALALGLFALVNLWLGARFAADAAAAKGADVASRRTGPVAAARFSGRAFPALVRKELRLLRRDAALLSQVLLRTLYLIPMTLILVKNAGDQNGLALPGGAGAVVFMAGQVAGSLSWITLCTEEAPDLLASAPTPVQVIRRAKLTAALAPLGLMLLPLGVLAWFSPLTALVTLAGSLAAAWASGMINIWYQKPARRSDFRRRRGSSWYALWAEAAVCGMIATATGFAAAGSVWALGPLTVAGVLLLALRRTDAQIAEALRTAG